MLTHFHVVVDFVHIFRTTKIETDITDLFGNSFQKRIITQKPVERFAFETSSRKVLKITKLTGRNFEQSKYFFISNRFVSNYTFYYKETGL